MRIAQPGQFPRICLMLSILFDEMEACLSALMFNSAKYMYSGQGRIQINSHCNFDFAFSHEMFKRVSASLFSAVAARSNSAARTSATTFSDRGVIAARKPFGRLMSPGVHSLTCSIVWPFSSFGLLMLKIARDVESSVNSERSARSRPGQTLDDNKDELEKDSTICLIDSPAPKPKNDIPRIHLWCVSFCAQEALRLELHRVAIRIRVVREQRDVRHNDRALRD